MNPVRVHLRLFLTEKPSPNAARPELKDRLCESAGYGFSWS